jgi:hypothetical protein
LLVVVIALVVSIACAIAAGMRLFFVYEAVSFDPELVARELRGDEGRAFAPALLSTLETAAPSADERGLLAAVRGGAGPERDEAEMSEQLLELEHRFNRWVRVPRVCASIASSAGLLLATWAMRLALADAPALGDERFRTAIEAAIGRALGVAAIGAAGTVTCIALFHEARRLARARREAAVKVIERMHRLVDDPAGATQSRSSFMS